MVLFGLPTLGFAEGRTFYVSASPVAGVTVDSGDIQSAVDQVGPGDTVLVFPGQYAPFEVRISGTSDALITIAAAPDQDGIVEIDGTGEHVRGLIEIRGQSHIVLSGFHLRNAPRDGIFVEGSDAGNGNIRIADNTIETVGNSGIYAAGIVMRHVTDVGEYRLFDIVIERNSVTDTNVPDGVNEAITLGGGVSGFVIRDNHVFDSDQYGIDVKAGAINGVVSGNLIHGLEKHGIYLDAGSRTVANIEVSGNVIYGSRNGIVIARESDRDPANPNLFGIGVFGNTLYNNAQYGILIYRHRDDSGAGLFGDIAVRDNVICGNGSDAVRLGGIGSFAQDISVERNLVYGNGGGIWNDIEASVDLVAPPASGTPCPPVVR